MTAVNYGDVLDQLRAAGLIVDGIEAGRLVRCRVDGDREKRGWYALHEVTGDGGDLILVGTFGAWRGNDSGAQSIKLTGRKISAEQREAIRLRAAADRKRVDADRRRSQENAARRAESAWRRYAVGGDSDYLAGKGVQGYGVRYTATGSVVVPVMDAAGRVHGLQFLRTPKQAEDARRPRKEFWPAGMAKKGHFHLIGMPSTIVFVAEGYATAASVHAATSGLPVAVAFDAGGLIHVATALRERYRRAKIVIVADDDCWTDGNPGVTAAQNAALAVNGSVFVPRWADDAWRQAQHAAGKSKLTDANDLAATDGLAALTAQLQAHLAGIGWTAGGPARLESANKGAGQADLEPIGDLSQLLDRFALVYGQSGTVFDALEHKLVALSDMRDICSARQLHRAWMEHPARKIVRAREVGFDPGGDDPAIRCNLWGGWPTEPCAGRCERLLELLQFLCSGERNSERLYRWVLCWLAYPLQHPGAKMKSALVFHGLQGTGKNLFFETVMAIYGRYGGIVDQSAVEDRFNDWASAKLFLVADEVIARSDVYHVKNKLKSFITGDWVRINPKNLAAYDERNHVNMVFLSNEDMPVVLEEDDRRHGVVWTPPPKPREFYDAVLAELADGGAAALHDYLLHLDLGDFAPGARPPETAARGELINLARDSTSRFFEALNDGDVPTPEPLGAALAADVFDLYKTFCGRIGYKPTSMPRLQHALSRRFGQRHARKRYLGPAGIVGPHGVFLFGQAPDGVVETTWIGDGIAAFRRCLEAYKGAL